MVNLSPLRLQALLCVLSTPSAASPAPRATNSVPLPTPPAGSEVVFVGATDPGIVWSEGWKTGPSPCSSETTRTASAVGFDSESNYYTATYNFRGSGIYANLQSGAAEFAITLDGAQTSFGSGLLPVPANCSYDWSETDLADDVDHVFMLITLGPSVSQTSFWTVGLESLAIIQPSSNSSSGSSSSSGSNTQTPSGTDSSPSPFGSATGSGGGLSSVDIITIVTSIIGGVASIIAIIAGTYQFRKWRQAKKRPPSQDHLLSIIKEHK